MKRLIQSFALLVAAAYLAACATGGGAEDAAGAAAAGPGAEVEGARATGLAAGEGAQAEALGGDDGEPGPGPQVTGPLAKRRIYFEFDSSAVQQQYLDVVRAHARYLMENGEEKVLLQGHADERGSREYNIGLGDRRARAVKQLMVAEGVSVDRIETVSFGEEKPAVEGHNEEAWAKNRRVRIEYVR